MAGSRGDADAPASPRVLVIDDNATVRRVLREKLVAPPLSATVTEADDGSTGLRSAMESELDCVLCDIAMSRIDGIAFLRMIRAQRSPLDLPIVLMTAHDAVAQRVAGFRCGASDFVSKPFEFAELMARVQTQVTLARMNRELTRMAHFDPLTGACNRRRFMGEFQRELARARRLERRFAIALLDLDFFKQINDTHGHPTGDAVLVDLVRVTEAQRRPYDTLGRMGGEEFALLLPEVSAINAAKIAERLRAAVEQANLGGLPAGTVTVSIGIAEGPLHADDGLDAMYKRADEMLYLAKHSGRNRACAAASGEEPPPSEGVPSSHPTLDPPGPPRLD